MLGCKFFNAAYVEDSLGRKRSDKKPVGNGSMEVAASKQKISLNEKDLGKY